MFRFCCPISSRSRIQLLSTHSTPRHGVSAEAHDRENDPILDSARVIGNNACSCAILIFRAQTLALIFSDAMLYICRHASTDNRTCSSRSFRQISPPISSNNSP